MDSSRLTFFCELDSPELEELFADPDLIHDLQALRARVSLGLLDLSPGRAAVVQRLNKAGIPMVAWLLLPKQQGYWFNLDNAHHATDQVLRFITWTTEHGLQWDAIGLDIEPDYNELHQLLGPQRWQVLPRLLPRIIRRALNGQRLHRGQATYANLVACIRQAGYPVETYQFPLIVDERCAGSTALQRLLGIVDLPSDQEVLMLYSSFLGAAGPGILWSYASQAGGVGIGSTGGGVEAGDSLPTLSWTQLARDLRLAQSMGKDAFIFSLEGAVRQGYLTRLRTFDWQAPVQPPIEAAARVDVARKLGTVALRASTQPALLFVAVLAFLHLTCRLRSSGARNRATSHATHQSNIT
jgi:hypothetical protein